MLFIIAVEASFIHTTKYLKKMYFILYFSILNLNEFYGLLLYYELLYISYFRYHNIMLYVITYGSRQLVGMLVLF